MVQQLSQVAPPDCAVSMVNLHEVCRWRSAARRRADPNIRDAGHIALATVHEMDILLTWNCRHIANAFIQAKLRKLADAAGFTLPVICTPEELLEKENEQND
jgi:hypothetical protein